MVSLVTYRSDLSQVKDALASLVGYAGMQVVVVDNDSGTDYQTALAALVDEMGQGGLTIELLRAPRNGGFGYGHNLAMLYAPASEYVLMLNPDAALHKGCVETLIAFLQSRPEVGLVVPKVFYPDGRLQPLNKRNPTVMDLSFRLFLPAALTRIAVVRKRLEKYSMMDMGYDTPYRLPFASGCCMMFRRSILMRLGGFDEGFLLYFEDADISQRANILSEVWFCPDAHITHAWQRGSRKSWKLLWIMLQSAARYFAKWGLKLW
jgi:GT2 family glycosyltransferase